MRAAAASIGTDERVNSNNNHNNNVGTVTQAPAALKGATNSDEDPSVAVNIADVETSLTTTPRTNEGAYPNNNNNNNGTLGGERTIVILWLLLGKLASPILQPLQQPHALRVSLLQLHRRPRRILLGNIHETVLMCVWRSQLQPSRLPPLGPVL